MQVLFPNPAAQSRFDLKAGQSSAKRCIAVQFSLVYCGLGQCIADQFGVYYTIATVQLSVLQFSLVYCNELNFILVYCSSDMCTAVHLIVLKIIVLLLSLLLFRVLHVSVLHFSLQKYSSVYCSSLREG